MNPDSRWNVRYHRNRELTLDAVRADVLAVVREAQEPLASADVAFVLRATDGIQVQLKAISNILATNPNVKVSWEYSRPLYSWDSVVR